MTKEETRRLNRRIIELRKGNLKEQIMAILMDTEIGGQGCFENGAEKKASFIIKLLKHGVNLSQMRRYYTRYNDQWS